MPGTWRSGRRPMPTATLKVVRGSVRIRGRRQEQEPQFQRGVPEPPSTVLADSEALAHWRRLAETLDAAGIITTAHTEALAMLAHAAADYDRTRAQLTKMNFQPLVVDEIRGTDGIVLRRRIRENPLHRRSERLATLVTKLLAEFGMTPTSAPRVPAALPGSPDPFEAFLSQQRPR